MPRWGGTLEQNSTKSNGNSPIKAKENESTANNEDSISNEKTTYKITDDSNLFTLSYIKQFSPRSHEAMRRHGVIPREILFKTSEWFTSHLPESTPEDIGQIRFNHYQTKRKALLRDLKKSRQSIIASNWSSIPVLTQIDNKLMSRSASTSKLATPRKSKTFLKKTSATPSKNKTDKKMSRTASTRSLSNNPEFEALLKDERFATEVAKEEEYFHHVVSRQKCDLEKMIAYEIKMMLQRKAQESKMLHQNEYQESLRNAFDDRMEQIRIKKYKQEERKRFLQEEKERNEKMAAIKEFQQRVNHKKQMESQNKLKKKMEQENIKHQQQKQQEFAEQTFEKQQAIRQKRREKLRAMIMQDEQRNRKLAERKRIDAMTKAEKLKKKQQRVREAYLSNERIRNQKLLDLKRKKEEEQKAVERFLERKRKENEARKQKAAKSDEKRKRAKEISENKVKALAKKTMDKERQMEIHRKKMEETRAKESRIKSELKRLRQQEKLQNIERNKRIQKYKRVSLNKKQEYEQERMRAIDQFKETMVTQRKCHSESSVQQRKQIIKQFSILLKSDKLSDINEAIESMLNLADTHLGDTKGLQDRLQNDFGIDLNAIQKHHEHTERN